MIRICLNMIVRDESANIARCLRSVKAHINAWCIVDTGSVDDTMKQVWAELEPPGMLGNHPWRDFAYNRTQAMELAKKELELTQYDYLLFLDADDWLEFPADFQWPILSADCYALPIRYGHVSYRRPMLIRASLPWRWEGVLHEYLTGPENIQHADLAAPTLVIGGKNKDRAHYARDAGILTKALTDPNLTEHLKQRYTFYLAQSWRDAGEPATAMNAYQARAAMGGWPEEVYVSLLEAARCRTRCEAPDDDLIIANFLRAWNIRPQRAEALGELALWSRNRGMNHLGYLFAQHAVDIPLPADALFVEPDWYRWRARDELAVNAYWTGRYAESRRLCEGLLIDRHLPEAQQARVRANLHHAIDKGG